MIRKTIAALAALAAAVPASAGNLMLGPVKFHPNYKFETRYEDNIYRVPRDQNGYAVAGGGVRGSWIFSNALGLGVEAPVTEHSKLSLDYLFTAENYTKQSKANDAYNQNASASWDFKGSKTKAQAYDRYVNTQDPAFNPNGNVVNGALVQRERRWQNEAGANGEYYLGDKFFAGADFSNTQDRYLDRSGGSNSLANLLDRSTDRFGVKAGYQVMPKTRVFVAEHRKLVHYTEHTRLDNHRDWDTDFGVEGQMTGKLKGLVQTGFVYQKYDYDPANAGRKLDGRHWSYLARLAYQATRNTKAVLTGARNANDSSASNSQYYIATGVNLALDHKFTEKISAGVNGGVEYDKYSDDFTVGTVTKSRRDDNYTAGAHADYQALDWLSVGASFLHNSRFSSFSREYSYRDNITGVNLKAMF